MTAAELIALLRSRPVACGRLGVVIGRFANEQYAKCPLNEQPTEVDWLILWERGEPQCFLNWLTGAAVNWCDERGIKVDRDAEGFWFYQLPPTTAGSIVLDRHPGTGYAARLHALLAAIEAAEETPNA